MAEKLTDGELRDARGLALLYRHRASVWPRRRWLNLAMWLGCWGMCVYAFRIMLVLVQDSLGRSMAEDAAAEPATKADVQYAMATAEANANSLTFAIALLTGMAVLTAMAGWLLFDRTVRHWRRHRRDALLSKLILHSIDDMGGQ